MQGSRTWRSASEARRLALHSTDALWAFGAQFVDALWASEAQKCQPEAASATVASGQPKEH